jgi:choline dehydrogenase-like flavoprotein
MTAALKIEGPDSVNWSDTADVVIVGFGGAGATVAATVATDRSSR